MKITRKTGIKAFFGSREKQKAIGSWDTYDLHHPSEEVTYLDHGYDESKKLEDLTLEDLRKAAEFRGGKCLAEEIPDIYTPIPWQCADGHEFQMSVKRGAAGRPLVSGMPEARMALRRDREEKSLLRAGMDADPWGGRRLCDSHGLQRV